MAIWNLGSINIDQVYSVPHIPAPGETLAATERAEYLGGKGANMSVALARAGSRVHHIGAVGEDGRWGEGFRPNLLRIKSNDAIVRPKQQLPV